MKKIIFLLLAIPAATQAIEPYRADQVEVYRGSGIEPSRAGQVREKRGNDIQPYQAETVEPHQGAPGIGNRAASQAKPAGNEGIEIVRLPPQPAGSVPSRPEPLRSAASAKSVVGLWQTNIPGAVYTTPSGLTGYDVLHVSTGAAAGLLRIDSNGTYSWNSYGGKKGKWVSSTDPEYPIELVDTVENRRWRVGYSGSKGVLYILSGSIWYEGRKASLKKK